MTIKTFNVPSVVIGADLDGLREKFWRWFNDNEHVVALEIRIWFLFRKTLTVGDLQPLFERLFGFRMVEA